MKEFLDSFNEAVDKAMIFTSITRNSDLQRDECVKLHNLLMTIADLKKQMIENRNEDAANLLLGCECAASSVIAEIKMWLLLKEDRPEEAWDELVHAQNSSAAAVRAHSGFSHLVENSRKLETIEGIVFPPQVFLSAGLIVDFQECSICSNEYGTCTHLAGKPYMGKFCQIITKGLKANHMAIVDHPADKKCTVREFKVAGGYRNRMTWLVKPSDDMIDEDSSTGGLLVRARLLGTGS